jgi:hypothetical protein
VSWGRVEGLGLMRELDCERQWLCFASYEQLHLGKTQKGRSKEQAQQNMRAEIRKKSRLKYAPIEAPGPMVLT